MGEQLQTSFVVRVITSLGLIAKGITRCSVWVAAVCAEKMVRYHIGGGISPLGPCLPSESNMYSTLTLGERTARYGSKCFATFLR
jgi:hypothetical protein